MKKNPLLAILIGFAFTAFNPASGDLLTNGNFEAGSSDWTTFGNAFFEQVDPPIDAAFEESLSLKMFGNFTGSTNYTGAFQDVAVDGVNVDTGDLLQLSGFIAQTSVDSLGGPNVRAFLEVTFVDTDGGLGEFGFGDNKSDDFTNSNTGDSWDSFFTPGFFVPVEAEFVRVKAVFVQEDSTGGADWVQQLQLNQLTPVPEPSSWVFVGLIAAGLASQRRRRLTSPGSI